MSVIRYSEVWASFVTFPRSVAFDNLVYEIQRHVPEINVVDGPMKLNLVEWPALEIMHNVQSPWLRAPTLEVVLTNRAFCNTTKEGASVVALSPSEETVLGIQDLIANRLKGDALRVDVPAKEFFERLPARIERYSEVTGDPKPYLTFSGLLVGLGDSSVAIEFPGIDTDWPQFEKMIGESWLRMYESLRFRAAYITINGVEVNVFGNGTAAIFTEEFGPALEAGRVASVLFDFQLTPA